MPLSPIETVTSVWPVPDANEDPLWVGLVGTSHMEPNPYFVSLTEVNAHSPIVFQSQTIRSRHSNLLK